MFGRVWHFWRGACSVLEGHDILEELLAEFWRGVAFLEGTCSVMEGAWRGVALLEGTWMCVAFLEGCSVCLQCFGSA